MLCCSVTILILRCCCRRPVSHRSRRGKRRHSRRPSQLTSTIILPAVLFFLLERAVIAVVRRPGVPTTISSRAATSFRRQGTEKKKEPRDGQLPKQSPNAQIQVSRKKSLLRCSTRVCDRSRNRLQSARLQRRARPGQGKPGGLSVATESAENTKVDIESRQAGAAEAGFDRVLFWRFSGDWQGKRAILLLASSRRARCFLLPPRGQSRSHVCLGKLGTYLAVASEAQQRGYE